MKILHVISSGGMYGAEAVILNLSRTLNKHGHASVLGVFSNTSNPNLQLHEAAIREGIESHLIPCNGQIDWTVATSIRQLAEATGADLIHAHGYKADVYTYFALRRTKLPFVSTCHNWLKEGLLVSCYGMVDRFVLRNYAAVIAVSDEVKAQLLKAGVRKDKIHLIRNGIDLRPFEQATPSLRVAFSSAKGLTVGWIGRLSREKGADIFLRAVAIVVAEHPDARFVVVGDGPDLSMLNALMQKLDIEENVSFVGRRGDMPGVYASLDVMVSSSRQEGLPMAILEGMASSLALVATAVGDVPTLVLDGRTGITVPSEDVELLAAGIARLLQDPEIRERYGKAARKLVEEQFSAEQMAAEYLRVYADAAPENNGRANSSQRHLASDKRDEAQELKK